MQIIAMGSHFVATLTYRSTYDSATRKFQRFSRAYKMKQSAASMTQVRFGDVFCVAPALDEETRNLVHYVRHEVYARELGFEPMQNDEREVDVYDKHSLHCLLRTRGAVARPVGCVRIVLTDPSDRRRLLPFEEFCGTRLDRNIIDSQVLPRHKIAEVSRLAVLKAYRSWRDDASAELKAGADTVAQPTTQLFAVPISLYFGAVAMARRAGVEYLFTLTEPRLAKHFERGGVKVEPIGVPVEHRGQRVPSLMRVSQVHDSVRAMVRPIWHEVNAQVDMGYLMNQLMVGKPSGATKNRHAAGLTC